VNSPKAGGRHAHVPGPRELRKPSAAEATTAWRSTLSKFAQLTNANFRIIQAPGIVAITDELIHDTRVIPIEPVGRTPLSPAIRLYMGDARGHWEGATLVVETTNLKASTRGSTPGLRLVELNGGLVGAQSAGRASVVLLFQNGDTGLAIGVKRPLQEIVE
jgi:hypothetical protein